MKKRSGMSEKNRPNKNKLPVPCLKWHVIDSDSEDETQKHNEQEGPLRINTDADNGDDSDSTYFSLTGGSSKEHSSSSHSDETTPQVKSVTLDTTTSAINKDAATELETDFAKSLRCRDDVKYIKKHSATQQPDNTTAKKSKKSTCPEIHYSTRSQTLIRKDATVRWYVQKKAINKVQKKCSRKADLSIPKIRNILTDIRNEVDKALSGRGPIPNKQRARKLLKESLWLSRRLHELYSDRPGSQNKYNIEEVKQVKDKLEGQLTGLINALEVYEASRHKELRHHENSHREVNCKEYENNCIEAERRSDDDEVEEEEEREGEDYGDDSNYEICDADMQFITESTHNNQEECYNENIANSDEIDVISMTPELRRHVNDENSSHELIDLTSSPTRVYNRMNSYKIYPKKKKVHFVSAPEIFELEVSQNSCLPLTVKESSPARTTINTNQLMSSIQEITLVNHSSENKTLCKKPAISSAIKKKQPQRAVPSERNNTEQGNTNIIKANKQTKEKLFNADDNLSNSSVKEISAMNPHRTVSQQLFSQSLIQMEQRHSKSPQENNKTSCRIMELGNRQPSTQETDIFSRNSENSTFNTQNCQHYSQLGPLSQAYSSQTTGNTQKLPASEHLNPTHQVHDNREMKNVADITMCVSSNKTTSRPIQNQHSPPEKLVCPVSSECSQITCSLLQTDASSGQARQSDNKQIPFSLYQGCGKQGNNADTNKNHTSLQQEHLSLPKTNFSETASPDSIICESETSGNLSQTHHSRIIPTQTVEEIVQSIFGNTPADYPRQIQKEFSPPEKLTCTQTAVAELQLSAQTFHPHFDASTHTHTAQNKESIGPAQTFPQDAREQLQSESHESLNTTWKTIVPPSLPWQTGQELTRIDLPEIPVLPCPLVRSPFEFTNFKIPKLPWENKCIPQNKSTNVQVHSDLERNPPALNDRYQHKQPLSGPPENNREDRNLFSRNERRFASHGPCNSLQKCAVPALHGQNTHTRTIPTNAHPPQGSANEMLYFREALLQKYRNQGAVPKSFYEDNKHDRYSEFKEEEIGNLKIVSEQIYDPHNTSYQHANVQRMTSHTNTNENRTWLSDAKDMDQEELLSTNWETDILDW